MPFFQWFVQAINLISSFRLIHFDVNVELLSLTNGCAGAW